MASFLKTRRARSLFWQGLAIAVVFAIVGWLAHNTMTNLASRGIMVGFDFLGRSARFPISESVVPYEPTDSFGWAFLVGLGNTLYISFVIIALSTGLGLVLALARRSPHPLASGAAGTLVDVTRNTPLVVQLLFWYGAVTFGLPSLSEAMEILPGAFLTDRGLFLPRIHPNGPIALVILVALAGLVLAAILTRRDRRERIETGRYPHMGRRMLVATVIVSTLLWVGGGVTLQLEYPYLGRFNFLGGVTLTPEFVAVIVGLTLYSAGFSVEIIRGGIDAVSRGQWEAARALGLGERQTLRLVILPQALRTIIPPMTSQFIHIVKNSTLALVVAYPELNFITATTINQTGQALEGIAILMAIFMAISLSASVFMNICNKKLALVER